MARIDLTDSDIQELLILPKVFPANYSRRFQLKPRRGHSEAQMDLTAETGHQFRFILRQSFFNSLDFSAILGYILPDSGRLFLLTRYNGKAHEHTNNLEKELPFYDFHIHKATERYQAHGYNEEKYAVTTNRYATLRQASSACCKTAES